MSDRFQPRASSDGAGGGISQLQGDVTAVGPGVVTATVEGLQGNPVDAAEPDPGDVLTWDGATWLPAAPAPQAPTYNVVSRSAAYPAVADDVVLCDTSLAGFPVTLPTAVGVSGKTITVKKVSSDGNTLTVDTTSGQTIDGQAQQAWTTQYTSMTVCSDNANWYIL